MPRVVGLFLKEVRLASQRGETPVHFNIFIILPASQDFKKDRGNYINSHCYRIREESPSPALPKKQTTWVVNPCLVQLVEVG